MKKFFALLSARNKEFYRDKGTLVWAIAFPFVIIVGFAFAFSGGSQEQYKVAVYDPRPTELSRAPEILKLQYVQYVPVTELESAIEKVKRHQFDLLVAPGAEAGADSRYWINMSSPKGYFMERMLPREFVKQPVEGRETRYVDWLLPGVLAMNMMFSALFGVGYTIVRYRKNGVLKRFKATPLHAFQFLSAQLVSRMLLIIVVSAFVYAGCAWLVGFEMRGSYLDLALFYSLGSLSMIAVSMLVAARVSSEELGEGLLNVLTWPMMLFSGVWFSLEGANPTLRKIAQVFPMTHVVDGARAIMIDGAALTGVMPQVVVLGAMTVVCMAIGSAFFKWN
jgi:ABC-2 type transport system permease protein